MPDEIAYQEALDYLYTFIDYSLTRSFRYSPEKFDLRRMFTLLEKLGNPHQAYPVIHVAGTKGKGSVSSLIASALNAQGYKTGLYTSPHLDDYAERIQINRQKIGHGELAALVDEIKPHVSQTPGLTTFELTTALAFLYFARQNIEAAVIEVGLGGRLDATNVVAPRVSVITSVSFDHTAVLGNTLAAIAGEKAGIIKPGCPVVISPQKSEARQVIEKIASEKGAPLIQVGSDIRYAARTHSLDGQTFLVWEAADQPLMDAYLENEDKTGWAPVSLDIPLLGYHQIENAATAYAALLVARRSGLPVSLSAIRRGFANVTWQGRFEVLQRANPPVVIDSAHNDDSALRLRLALEDYFPGKPVVMVFGASEDKDVNGMFSILLPRVRQVIATQSIHPRAMEPEKLADLARQHGVPSQAVLPLEAALQQAIASAGNDALVLATGSLFIAAAVRSAFHAFVIR